LPSDRFRTARTILRSDQVPPDLRRLDHPAQHPTCVTNFPRSQPAQSPRSRKSLPDDMRMAVARLAWSQSLSLNRFWMQSSQYEAPSTSERNFTTRSAIVTSLLHRSAATYCACLPGYPKTASRPHPCMKRAPPGQSPEDRTQSRTVRRMPPEPYQTIKAEAVRFPGGGQRHPSERRPSHIGRTACGASPPPCLPPLWLNRGVLAPVGEVGRASDPRMVSVAFRDNASKARRFIDPRQSTGAPTHRRVAFPVPTFTTALRFSCTPRYCCNRTRIRFRNPGPGRSLPFRANARTAITPPAAAYLPRA